MSGPSGDKCQNLLTAARRADIAAVRRFLKSGESPNCIDESGFTPLMLLASQGQGECLQVVLDAPGCIVNKRTSSMQVALQFAAEKGHADCTRRLLEGRAMVNVSNDWGETPLIKAVTSGNLDTVELLLRSGAKTDMTDLQGCNALIHAAKLGNVSITSALVRNGACVNHGMKTLPLHQAVAYGHVETVRALLGFGARPTIRDLHGWLPIEIATHTDQSGAIECLIAHGASQEDIDATVTAAAKYNAARSIRVLLKMGGGDPDATDYQGMPALFTAVDLSNVDIVWLLIQYNCNVGRSLSRVYLPDSELHDIFTSLHADLISPLMLAIVRGSATIVRMLAFCSATGSALRTIKAMTGSPPSNVLSTSSMEAVTWLTQYFCSPSSLAHLSRLAVRRALGRRAPDSVAHLPIPRQLMDYLRLVDVAHDLELRDSEIL